METTARRFDRPAMLNALSLLLTIGCSGAASPVDPVPSDEPAADPSPTSGTFSAPVEAGSDGAAGASLIDATQGLGGAMLSEAGAAPARVPAKCTARFCDDFERFAVGQTPGSPWASSTYESSTVTIDDQKSFSGGRSVHVHAVGSGYQRAYFTVAAPAVPTSSNVVYGRMMVWITEAAPDGVHVSMIEGSGNPMGQTYLALYRYGSFKGKRLMANYDTRGVTTDFWQDSTTVVPERRWACMMWRFNGPNDELNFWLDGKPIDELTVVDKSNRGGSGYTNGVWVAPVFDHIYLGWESYQKDTDREMWIDDVVIDDKPVDCPVPL